MVWKKNKCRSKAKLAKQGYFSKGTFMSKNKHIFLVAGGTGGHLFPAESLGTELLNRGYTVHLLTDHRIMHFKSALHECPVHKVYSSPIKAGLFGKLKSVFIICLGLLQSLFLILKYNPSAIIGFGGYPSFPPLFIGQILGKNTFIHEQNAVLGVANAKLKKKATALALSLPDTKQVFEKDMHKVKVTGNPARTHILKFKNSPYHKSQNDETFNLLITGGSHGASLFSKVIPDALAKLSEPLKQRLNVVQQCRAEDIEQVKEFYASHNISCDLSTFFDDIGKRIKDAHLIIARSGASTVNDIVNIGRPAIFVPMSLHADQQQKHNANLLVEKEACIMMVEDAFNPDSLSAQIETLMRLPDKLEAMAKSSSTFGNPEAAINLADLIEEKI
tara:strand:+ start:1563 stop:2729 length:1167 start_codon:yes stop_codon:yes gene_type:complete